MPHQAVEDRAARNHLRNMAIGYDVYNGELDK